MRIGCSEHQCFFIAFRIELMNKLFDYGSIKVFTVHKLIELINLYFQFVLQFIELFHGIGFLIVNLRLFSFFPNDSFFTQLRFKNGRRLVVDQKSIDDRFTISVVMNWLTKYLPCMQCRCGRKSDRESIKVLQHPAILADVILLIFEVKV